VSQDIADEYAKLIAERELPAPFILRAIVLTQGALWRRQATTDASRTKRQASPELIMVHLLAMHRALWDAGHAEVIEGMKGAQGLDQRITAELRRMLDALRVVSKWVRANMQGLLDLADTPPLHLSDAVQTRLRAELDKFWPALAQFATALEKAFPRDALPQIKTPLAEDVEMRGFLPVRGLMLGEAETSEHQAVSGESAVRPVLEAVSDVHPNVEHLMRINDLIMDAHILAGTEVCHPARG
jgi:protein SMG7